MKAPRLGWILAGLLACGPAEPERPSEWAPDADTQGRTHDVVADAQQ